MKTTAKDSMQVPRIVLRIFSALIVVFSLMMVTGAFMESAKRGSSAPVSFTEILQFIPGSIGLLGYIVAWKWEISGGTVSLLAFVTIFIVNPSALVSIMLLFPAVAILFILLGFNKRKRFNHKG